MPKSSARIVALQRRIARLSRPRVVVDAGTVPTGDPAIDSRIGGGLARGQLHEVFATDARDAAAGAGFAAMLSQRIGGALVWLRIGDADRCGGAMLYPPGLREVGIDPESVLLVLTPDAESLLRAAGEVVRCSAVGAAVIELWRDPQRIDLTASRRLVLAAEASGVTPLLLRIAAEPAPSAAQTRWGVRAAPSSPLPGDPTGAPGLPAFEIELLRQRGGPAGWRWRVEWDRDRVSFGQGAGSPLPGDLAAISDGGPASAGAIDRRRRAI